MDLLSALLFGGASSAIDFGFGALQGAINSSYAAAAAEESYKYQKKLMYQQQYNNIELAHLQNAINTDAQYRSFQHQQNLWNQSVQLANSAHQREVADLRAAGLNPILSTHASGAPMASAASVPTAHVSTGSSGLGSVHQTPAQMRMEYRTNLLNAVTTAKQLQIQDAQVKKLDAESNYINNMSLEAGVRAEKLLASRPYFADLAKLQYDQLKGHVLNSAGDLQLKNQHFQRMLYENETRMNPTNKKVWENVAPWFGGAKNAASAGVSALILKSML